MDNHHLKLGALNTKTNKYTRPNEADKISEYKCIECSEKVIFKKGMIRIPHFSHYAHSNCTYYDHPNESQIHKDAKLKIKDLLKNGNTLQFNNFCRKCKSDNEQKIICEENDDVVLELRDVSGQWIADVAVIDQNKKSKFIIEIKNTHFTETERPEPWVEVEAKDVIELNNNLFRNIREYICNKCLFVNKDEQLEKIENNVVVNYTYKYSRFTSDDLWEILREEEYIRNQKIKEDTLRLNEEWERIQRENEIRNNRLKLLNKNKYGALDQFNKYTLPDDVNKDRDYRCVVCLEPVILKIKEDVVYFKHMNESGCKYFIYEPLIELNVVNENDLFEEVKCFKCNKIVYPNSGFFHYVHQKCSAYFFPNFNQYSTINKLFKNF
jgi:hypothetical protein